MIMRLRDVFAAVFSRVIIVALVGALYLLIILLALWIDDAGDVIEIEARQWQCIALDASDGQCATYQRDHSE